MTAVATPAVPAPDAVTPPPRAAGRRSVVIENVDWETYERLLEAFGERRGVRLAYDSGALEIMAPIGFEHEGDKDVLGDLVKALGRAFRLPVRGGGSVTVRRKEAEKGIEPDNCYWVANAPRLAGVRRLDLTVHPPPDLAVEVDVTTNSLDKLRLYAGLGVPEFWRLDGDEIHFFRLGPGGAYAEVPASVAFPGITPAEVMRFVIDARGVVDPGDVVEAFREWLKGRAAGGA
jgi:Uma2 family endonuclease